MSTRVPDFYRSQLERAGWIRCSGAILGKWGSFIDEAKGPSITVYQFRELFQKRDAIAEVLIEQVRPDAAIADKQATQTVLVRVKTNEPKACS